MTNKWSDLKGDPGFWKIVAFWVGACLLVLFAYLKHRGVW